MSNVNIITLPVMSANVFIQLNNCVIAAFERKLQKLTKTNPKLTLNDIEHKTCCQAVIVWLLDTVLMYIAADA